MESLDGCVLDRAVHPLDLSVRPGMIDLGEPVLDAILVLLLLNDGPGAFGADYEVLEIHRLKDLRHFVGGEHGTRLPSGSVSKMGNHSRKLASYRASTDAVC